MSRLETLTLSEVHVFETFLIVTTKLLYMIEFALCYIDLFDKLRQIPHYCSIHTDTSLSLLMYSFEDEEFEICLAVHV